MKKVIGDGNEGMLINKLNLKEYILEVAVWNKGRIVNIYLNKKQVKELVELLENDLNGY